jgi:hypothetical protein
VKPSLDGDEVPATKFVGKALSAVAKLTGADVKAAGAFRRLRDRVRIWWRR